MGLETRSECPLQRTQSWRWSPAGRQSYPLFAYGKGRAHCNVDGLDEEVLRAFFLRQNLTQYPLARYLHSSTYKQYMSNNTQEVMGKEVEANEVRAKQISERNYPAAGN